MVTRAGMGGAGGSRRVLREAVPPPVPRALDEALGNQAHAPPMLLTL